MGPGKRLTLPASVLLALVASSASGAGRMKVDFTEETIEGEILKPSGSFVIERRRAHFPCDITKLTLAQYNVCFEQHLSDLCGTQVIERDRFELQRISRAIPQVEDGRTLGTAFPLTFHLQDGAVFVQEASEFDGWSEAVALVKNQSPKLFSPDWFVPSGSAFLLGEQTSKRIFILRRETFSDTQPSVKKIEIRARTHSLLGVLETGKFVLGTTREVLLMNLAGTKAVKLKIPRDEYLVDTRVDRDGNMLLASRTSGGKVYVVDGRGQLVSSIDAEPDSWYRMMPSGLIASANRTTGVIKIRSRTGLVLSHTNLARTIYQFGIARSGSTADLFFVAADGLGVLYGDGFEKSFLSATAGPLRVVEADNGIFGVVTSSPVWNDRSKLRERVVDFYRLGKTPSKVSRYVDGICPGSIREAERALQLKPSLKASIKNGRVQLDR